MNCPHCQKLLPDNYTASYCPHCGGEVQQPTSPTPPGSPPLKPVKIKWPIFFVVLLAPPVLTSMVAFVGKGQSNESVSPIIALFGGGAAGVVYGILLALRIGRTVPIRVLLAILFAGILAV